MTRMLRAAVLVGALAAVATAGRAEDDKKGTNALDREAAAKATVTDAAKAVDQLALGRRLAAYGRATKSPEALALAARILADTPATNTPTKPTGEDARGAKPADKPARDDTPMGLLAEAKKLAGSDPTVAALAAKVEVEKARGAVAGARTWVETVGGGRTDQYTITFRGGEAAVFAVSGDGDTRLDLYVYDQNGNLIDSDVGHGDDKVCRWAPRWTGPFVIRVVNRGSVANRYLAGHN